MNDGTFSFQDKTQTEYWRQVKPFDVDWQTVLFFSPAHVKSIFFELIIP